MDTRQTITVPQKLCNALLNDVPSNIAVPTYDRANLTAGIVHIGLGNFHRAHQAWYLHRLMQQGLAHDWGIVGAGVRAADAVMRDKLLAQDCLTTLMELDPKGTSAEIIGSMIDFIPVDEDNSSLIARMSDPAIRIVALTVTEGGYYIDPVSKCFAHDHADILHDAADPSQPHTAFGAMIAALKKRRDAGAGPFTCQSCDNLQGNGDILRQTVVSLARMSDQALADWINVNCTFPNSMVDCIVPATGPIELALVNTFGIDDAAPVTHENFRQWVIEDKFCAGRPDWDRVGATFTDEVYAFEAMKIRILNGGHQLIANAGEVLSIEHISGCMDHRLISDYFRKTTTSEIAKQVHAVPGMTPDAYADLIDNRFSNAEIVDTVRRVAFDGSSRQTGFILPTLRDALANGDPMEGLALSQAIWARMCEGTREDGSIILPNDPIWEKLTVAARAAKTNPKAWLAQEDIYGDLADNAGFADLFERWLTLIWSDGLEAALTAYIQG